MLPASESNKLIDLQQTWSEAIRPRPIDIIGAGLIVAGARPTMQKQFMQLMGYTAQIDRLMELFRLSTWVEAIACVDVIFDLATYIGDTRLSWFHFKGIRWIVDQFKLARKLRTSWTSLIIFSRCVCRQNAENATFCKWSGNTVDSFCARYLVHQGVAWSELCQLFYWWPLSLQHSIRRPDTPLGNTIYRAKDRYNLKSMWYKMFR